jgi:hypothetical protein
MGNISMNKETSFHNKSVALSSTKSSGILIYREAIDSYIVHWDNDVTSINMTAESLKSLLENKTLVLL